MSMITIALDLSLGLIVMCGFFFKSRSARCWRVDRFWNSMGVWWERDDVRVEKYSSSKWVR